jgi:hypothetical protein
MNRIFNASLFTFLAVSLAGCTAEKLDGGSTGGSKGAGSIAAADISDAPLSGTIAAQPFEPKTIEIGFNERSGKWTLSIDNYEGNCGSVKNRPPSDESMTVNVIGLEPSKEWSVEQPIRYATLQPGVYMAAEEKQPDTRNATSGTVVLDGWDETPGATITGKLKLVADEESAVEGTFTAKVCPAR